MDKLSPEVIWYLFLFLVPGFLVACWVNLFLPLRPGSDNKNLITYVLLTLVVYLPILIFYGWYGKLPFLKSFHQMVWLMVGFLVFIPLAIGWALSQMVHSKKIWGWMERVLHVKAIHPVASAWDRAFLREDRPWLIVMLKEGKRLGGRWDDVAVASSDPNERDLFLGNVYLVSDEGTWTRNETSMGMLIKADQINLIEFIKPAEE
jgi:hypothetical protein